MSGYQTNHAGAAYGHGSGRLAAPSTGTNNSSVLRSINDILREGDYTNMAGTGHRSRSGSNSSTGAHHLYADYGNNASPTRRGLSATGYGSHSRGASPSRALNHHHYGPAGVGVPTEEERSMERLASTFRTEDYTSGLYERLHDFSPLASDQDVMMGGHHGQHGQAHMMANSHVDGYHQHQHQMQQHQQHHGYGQMAPTAMPLLPDMPSRSRKLYEDLAHANANDGRAMAMGTATDAPTMHIQSRGKYGVGSAAVGAAGAHQHTSHTSRYLSPR